MRDCDAHHHVLQVDDVVVGVVRAAGRFVHRAHDVLWTDGSAGDKRGTSMFHGVFLHLFMGGGAVKSVHSQDLDHST